ncbi:MAG: HdeD family acid-resistance protein [Gammaproteobacteria bacterium]
MKSDISSEFIQFTARPWWYTIRGVAMITVGGIIAVLCIIAPDVYMLGKSGSSWIPVIGTIVLLVGILHCIDALVSESSQGFLFNMQGGILDIVVGFLVLFSISDEPNSLNLLIVGYMLTQGIYRNVLLSAEKIPNPVSNRVTGLISIILGTLIWIDWPSAATWFLAFSLSVDIGFRGWVLIVMASSLKKDTSN